MNFRTSLPCLFLLASSTSLYASTIEGSASCFAKSVSQVDENTTVESIRERCRQELEHDQAMEQQLLQECLKVRAETAPDTATAKDVLAQCRLLLSKEKHLASRLVNMRSNELPLRQNYILPFSYNTSPNQAPFEFAGDELMQKAEVKMQLSFKIPLTQRDLLKTGDALYFGFTMKAFWQLYNSDISSPFRETNYRPEVFYQFPISVNTNRGVWLGRLGVEHESNGQNQYLSRSWNRVYAALAYMDDNWGVVLQPWYRLPEDAKEDDGDPDTPPPPAGDDNPDILDYMGHYQLTGAYRQGKIEYTNAIRYNFNTGKGAVELGVSFPLWHQLRGYVQYFDGYGESMIDYDHRNQRLGIGILLSDYL